jgi:flagellar transcriptional activator FlhD
MTQGRQVVQRSQSCDNSPGPGVFNRGLSAKSHTPLSWRTDRILNPQGHLMTSDRILEEIRDANLSYLMLAQNLIRADKAQALFRLGISEASADIIEMLSPPQVMKLASGNMLLCRFRASDDIVWDLLTHHNVPRREGNDAIARLHANIVLASRFAETTL